MTRILIIGLDCAAPELLLGDERLGNLRRLMAGGCHGRLESIVPPITVPAWACMATSQDPGSLGVYGFRNRLDHGYASLGTVTSASIRQPTIWDQVALEGGRASIMGVPPNYPPRPTSGFSVGCFLTPDTTRNAFALPLDIQHEITQRVGPYQVDVSGFRTQDKRRLLEQINAMSRQQFSVLRRLMRATEWDFLQFVEIGLDRLHHGFWRHHDPRHLRHEPDSPFADAIGDYYLHLDHEVGLVLDQLDEETLVLVASDHGAQRLDGGFCVNEFLIQSGLLVLHEYPDRPTPFSQLSVDWDRTVAWSEGGYYARVFMNVRGREPRGTIAAGDYQRVRRELQAQFEATGGPAGEPLGTRVFQPEAIYQRVEGIAPDLIVHFGGLFWRSIGSVGHGCLHVQENDTGPDDCNHAQFGAFILNGPGIGRRGRVTGAHLLDMAPTLLACSGRDVPRAVQGSCQWPVAGVRLERTETTEAVMVV